ncbi:SpoIID/LytB domain-containing protein [bacterium]
MKRTLLFLGFSLLIFIHCSIQPSPPAKPGPKKEPFIRVGIVWDIQSIDFSVQNGFQITNYDGTFIAKESRGGRWRAQIFSSEPGQTVYLLVGASMNSMQSAQAMAKQIQKKGFETFIQPTGVPLRINGKQVQDNRTYRVYLQKRFQDRGSAESYRDAIWNRLETFLVQQEVKGSHGKITLKNLENGQSFESYKPILIRGASVTLHGIPVGAGYHWEKKESRSFPEIIGFDLDSNGKLAVVNIVQLETYLQGVVPSEMPNGFPLEALKAQTVAARSEVLSKLGFVHTADPFDICADVHCQVYSGLTKRAASTDRAVRETNGVVLWKDGKICDAVYSAVCGGHGEDNHKVWGGQSKSYLKGSYDGSRSLKQYGSLDREKNVKRWLDTKPSAYCNSTKGWALPAMEYTKKYFRWTVQYTQNELRDHLKNYSGRDVGAIIDLIPLKRGSSGRITQLRVLGSRSEYIIEKELQIRRALANSTLWSSCFYVKKKRIRGNVPSEFELRGAGFGHGVGMCQTGAATMAIRGNRFHQILKHYYQDIRLKRLY